MLAGIDEAGRGCIIGPMAIAIALINEGDEGKLKALGVKDSKKLSRKQREELYPKIKEICATHVEMISAKKITDLMDTENLNDIEAMHIAKLLEKAPDGATAYIDSPDNKPENFALRLRNFTKKDIKLVCENKADDKFPIASAASIIAKVERDWEIDKIKKIVNFDFNSGYTSDPYTISFLAKHKDDANVREYLRLKWATLAGKDAAKARIKKAIKERKEKKQEKAVQDEKQSKLF